MPPRATEDGERLHLAEGFLCEVVFRSRAEQATSSVLAPALDASPKGRCGLGERASVVLDLSERGAEFFARLWPVEPPATEIARIQGVMRAWVIEQDALDRQRNHYLKAFRQAHGFDRARYSPAETAEFESGLARINSREDAARRAAAIALVSGFPSTPL